MMISGEAASQATVVQSEQPEISQVEKKTETEQSQSLSHAVARPVAYPTPLRLSLILLSLSLAVFLYGLVSLPSLEVDAHFTWQLLLTFL